MRAAIFRQGDLVVDEIDDPTPVDGQVLVRTLACGICGSDLHALRHASQLVDTARRAGAAQVMDLARDVVFGHEFCAELLEHGPGTTRTLKPGTRICSMPIAFTREVVRTIGYCNDAPGGFAERMALNEGLLLEVLTGCRAIMPL